MLRTRHDSGRRKLLLLVQMRNLLSQQRFQDGTTFWLIARDTFTSRIRKVVIALTAREIGLSDTKLVHLKRAYSTGFSARCLNKKQGMRLIATQAACHEFQNTPASFSPCPIARLN